MKERRPKNEKAPPFGGARLALLVLARVPEDVSDVADARAHEEDEEDDDGRGARVLGGLRRRGLGEGAVGGEERQESGKQSCHGRLRFLEGHRVEPV
jgi:hypothetical protein